MPRKEDKIDKAQKNDIEEAISAIKKIISNQKINQETTQDTDQEGDILTLEKKDMICDIDSSSIQGKKDKLAATADEFAGYLQESGSLMKQESLRLIIEAIASSLIKEWIDVHLPGMVEGLVKDEVKKITKKTY